MRKRVRALLAPPTDPAGLSRAPAAPMIFDPALHRNRGVPMALRPVGKPDSGAVLILLPGERPEKCTGPNDRQLIATQVALGMPRQAAEQVRYHGGARFLALRLWCDVKDAAEGDRAARERVDYYRDHFQTARRIEAIADDPQRTTPIV